MKARYLIIVSLLALTSYFFWTESSAMPTAATGHISATSRTQAVIEARSTRSSAPTTGHWQRYSLDFRAAATFDPGTDNEHTMDLSIRGLWKATQAAPNLYELKIENPHVALEGTDNRPTAEVERIEEALQPAHYIRIDDKGAIADVLVAPGTDPATWRIWFAVASFMQFQDGEGQQWTASELDPAGEYVAEYTQLGGDEYEKRKLQYLRVRADTGWVEKRELNLGIDGVLRITRRAEGLPQRVTGSDTAWTEEGALVKVSVKTDVSLGLSDSGLDSDASERFQGVEAQLLGGLSAPVRQELESRRSRSFDELMTQLDNSGESASLLIEELGLAMARDPSATALAIEILRTEAERDPGHVLVAALSAAGTAQAQQALRDIASDTDLGELIATEAIVEIGRTADPDQASVDLLIASLDDPRPVFSSTAALALGNAADQLGSSERGRAALARLIAKLEATNDLNETINLLAALGNSASIGALDAITPYLRAASEEVRAAAADALKLLPSPTVPQLLGELLSGDASTQVRSRAAYALGYCTGLPSFEALAAALRSEPDVAVRSEALASAAKVGAGSPDSIALLQWVASNDDSEKLRQEAARLL